MNVDKLLKQYFRNSADCAIIEVFDTDNIYSVYKDIVKALDLHPDIELSVLQSLSYCMYEILDNVLTHSSKKCGTVIVHFDKQNMIVKILVADDGVGIRRSLSENPKYNDISIGQALKLCVENSVTDGKGMGFGLYSTMRLINNAGASLVIRSENGMLYFDGNEVSVGLSDFWQGTIVYFEIHSNKIIDPRQVFEDKVNVSSDYDMIFDDKDGLDELW